MPASAASKPASCAGKIAPAGVDRNSSQVTKPSTMAKMAPCVVAGPTCDSVDVLYEKNPYPLPVSLAIGDKVLIEAAGAYTSSYSSIGFNGFPPLKSIVLGVSESPALAA